jgi:hypothetical protein
MTLDWGRKHLRSPGLSFGTLGGPQRASVSDRKLQLDSRRPDSRVRDRNGPNHRIIKIDKPRRRVDTQPSRRIPPLQCLHAN